jgi:2-oxoglutarate ferredoxin oxidoreductase subunit beta
MRSALEAIAELDVIQRTIAVFGIGCYTAFANNLDVEVLQALHGRAPSLATGVKRAKPNTLVVTIQGDGDMVNEGLQEVLHAAARGENVTCFMMDNGVFGETGGHMTATTALGQRTKNTLDGRDAAEHGFPIRVSNLIAELEGAAYVARGAVNNAGNVARTKKMIVRALETQLAGAGFSFVEILTMCPTGWFIETQEAPEYLTDILSPVHQPGVLKDNLETSHG